MRKFLVALVIVIVVLVGLYFGTSAVFAGRAASIKAELGRAGHPTRLSDLGPAFEAGSKATAETLRAAAALFEKGDRGRLAYFDTAGYRIDKAGLAQLLREKARAYELLLRVPELEPANFGMDYRAGMYARLSEVGPFFPSFRMLLSVKSRTLAAAGRADSAFMALGASVALARSLAEPVFIYTLVQVVGLDTAFTLAGQIAGRASPAAVSRFMAELERADFGNNLLRALEAEGVMVQHALDAGQTFTSFSDDAAKDVLSTPAIAFLPLRRYAQFRQLQALREQLEIAARPWYEGQALLRAHERSMAGDGFLAQVARLGVPNMTPMYLRMERIAARRDAAAFGLAMLLSQRQKAAPPEVPLDRFSGRSLCYKPLADGFVVYSVGSDGKDDGADPEKDVVFRVRM